MFAIASALLVEPGTAIFVFCNPFTREIAAANIGEHFAKSSIGFRRDHFGTARVVAIFGGVADRIAHKVQPTSIHEIHNQFQLMQALKVSDLRLISSLDQRFKSSFDQRAHSTAENSLLAKQIGFGFLGKSGLDHSGARAANSARVGERQGFSIAARVLMDGQQSRRSATFDKDLAHAMAWRLGGDHDYVSISRRLDRFEMNIETVREKQSLRGRECLSNRFVVQLRLNRIWNQDDEHITPDGSVFGRHDFKPSFAGFIARAARCFKGNADFYSAVAKVKGMRVPL